MSESTNFYWRGKRRVGVEYHREHRPSMGSRNAVLVSQRCHGQVRDYAKQHGVSMREALDQMLEGL